MAKRYTAIVEIIEVEENPGTGLSVRGTTAAQPSKESRELAKFIVRDEALEGLKVKLSKHIELV